MEICTKKLQIEYLPISVIHDRHLAQWGNDVNNKMIFLRGELLQIFLRIQDETFRKFLDTSKAKN